MEEDDGRSVTESGIRDFGVAAANAIHAGILMETGDFRRRASQPE
jgi:hypothetical protein